MFILMVMGQPELLSNARPPLLLGASMCNDTGNSGSGSGGGCLANATAGLINAAAIKNRKQLVRIHALLNAELKLFPGKGCSAAPFSLALAYYTYPELLDSTAKNCSGCPMTSILMI